ncbi:tetratricopeptide repeat protein [Oleiagrimonas sp.]|uniref:tetratricopeptide repeat protein n=1 Tax=Oleiagrimonas sp. TaxID=2010330 RepID=UPI00262EB61A|nr:tetratricopeptide repeat protein [Oleiagrimonas sp.]MDA3913901.1 tetratricopeptide repeat protein [Oleiagrimonas sp.]
MASFSKILFAAAVALMMVSGSAMAHGSNKSGEKKQSKYPNATRKAPKLDLTSQEDADTINKGSKAYNKHDYATAKKVLQPYADGTASKSKYAQVVALQIMGNIAYKEGHVDKAIQMLQKALTLNVMPNQTYFDLEYELSQFYMVNKQYQKSADIIDKWRQEGKLQTADSYGVQGVDYYRLGQYDKAIAAIKKAESMTDKPRETWNQVLAASYAESGNTTEAIAAAKAQLAKNPDDMTTLHNAVSLMVSAGNYDEATKLMEQAQTKGLLKKGKDYVLLAKLHLMKAQDAKDAKPEAQKAVSIIKQGIAKGVLKPGYESNKIQGDAAYFSDKINEAISFYGKAAQDAPDGKVKLQQAQLLLSQHEDSAARKASEAAIKQGLKHEGPAYMVIAEAERSMGNKSGAISAMKKAEKDPTTQAKAKAWLKKATR